MRQELGLFLLRHAQDEVHKAFRDQSREIGGIRTTCGDPRVYQSDYRTMQALLLRFLLGRASESLRPLPRSLYVLQRLGCGAEINVWDALSSYEKAAIRKLALGFDWEIPETVRRRLRSLTLVESGALSPADAGWKLHRANPRRKPVAKPRRSLIANPGEAKQG